MSTISVRALPGLSIQLQMKDPSFDVNQFVFVVQNTGAHNQNGTSVSPGNLIVQAEAASVDSGPCLNISLQTGSATASSTSQPIPPPETMSFTQPPLPLTSNQSPLSGFDTTFQTSLLPLESTASLDNGSSTYLNHTVDWNRAFLDTTSCLFQTQGGELNFADNFMDSNQLSSPSSSHSHSEQSGISSSPASSRASPPPPSSEEMDTDDDRVATSSGTEESKARSKPTRARRTVDKTASKPRDPPRCSFQGCNKTFSRRHDCLRHEVVKHGYQSEWTCRNCGKFFAAERSFQRHDCPSASGGPQREWTDRWSRPYPHAQPQSAVQYMTSPESVQSTQNAQSGLTASQQQHPPSTSKQCLDSFLQSCLQGYDGRAMQNDGRKEISS